MNTLSEVDYNKIQEFKELIQKHGFKKASEILKASGISYYEDFTTSHRSDPIFSSPIVYVDKPKAEINAQFVNTEIVGSGQIMKLITMQNQQSQSPYPSNQKNIWESYHLLNAFSTTYITNVHEKTQIISTT